MRASSTLNFEAGMSTESCWADSALRMRVRKSAIGSLTAIGLQQLPAGLRHAGHEALVRLLAQADPAEAELAEVRTRATAALAAVVVTGLELRFAALTHHL